MEKFRIKRYLLVVLILFENVLYKLFVLLRDLADVMFHLHDFDGLNTLLNIFAFLFFALFIYSDAVILRGLRRSVSASVWFYRFFKVFVDYFTYLVFHAAHGKPKLLFLELHLFLFLSELFLLLFLVCLHLELGMVIHFGVIPSINDLFIVNNALFLVSHPFLSSLLF